MNDDIHVIDDCLPEATYAALVGTIAAEPLNYGARSNSLTDPYGHWSSKFAPGSSHNLADFTISIEADARHAPIAAAWRHLRDKQLMPAALIRCYVNGYTYGTDSYFHRDSHRRDEWTAVLYLNEDWQPDWAGETTFLDERGEIARAVLPKRNRAVIFPANRLHAGRGVSRKCAVLRQTLIYKARLQRSERFEKLSGFLRDRGAVGLPHKSGSLHDHLVRTFAILEQCGFGDDICFGGGLHAVYGTSAFPRRLLARSDRAAVIDAFGAEAERLAYLFALLDRPKTLEAPLSLGATTAVVAARNDKPLPLPRSVFEALRAIECANLEDQNRLVRYPALTRFWNR